MGAKLVFDIEANDLLLGVTEIHCISTYDIESGISMHYGPEELGYGLVALMEAEVLIGHNIRNYDVPAIKKLYPEWKTDVVLIDTLVLGCILLPEAGILSLDDWAKRLHLKQQKVVHEDWTQYSQGMGTRCDGDVVINISVFQHLSNHKHYAMVVDAQQLEGSVAEIHSQQCMAGVRFDILKGCALLVELDDKIKERRTLIVQDAPKTVLLHGIAKCNQQKERRLRQADVDAGKIPKGTVLPFKKDKGYKEVVKKHFPGTSYLKVKGPYTRLEIKEFNPDSKDEVKEFLSSLGWVPTEWNSVRDKDTGEYRITSPKLTEDSYGSLPPGIGQAVAEYDMMQHRRRFLLNTKDDTKGALAVVKKRGTRVTPDAFTCGTPTGRYRHQGVVCNIPRPSTPYGKEIRSLFTVEDGNRLVGVDLSGIEARCLAWYLLRGKYKDARKTADLILSPDKGNDFHSYNAKQWGVSRDTAKSGLYALLYGAGAKKLANTLGKPDRMGTKLKRDFFKAHPGILELINDLESAYDRNGGYIKGIDGRPLYIRGTNRLLNTLLQSTAAVVFKRWMIKCEERRREMEIPERYKQVIAYHDELQFEVWAMPEDSISVDEYAESWARIVEALALEVGEDMGCPVPIEAEAKIGLNWSECH